MNHNDVWFIEFSTVTVSDKFIELALIMADRFLQIKIKIKKKNKTGIKVNINIAIIVSSVSRLLGISYLMLISCGHL